MHFHPTAIAAIMNKEIFRSMPGFQSNAISLLKYFLKDVEDRELVAILNKADKFILNAFYINIRIKFVSYYLKKQFPDLADTISNRSLKSDSEMNLIEELEDKYGHFLDVTRLDKVKFQKSYIEFLKETTNVKLDSVSAESSIQPNNSDTSEQAITHTIQVLESALHEQYKKKDEFKSQNLQTSSNYLRLSKWRPIRTLPNEHELTLSTAPKMRSRS